MSRPCTYGLPFDRCMAAPFCGCDDEHEAAKPLPDPEQLAFDGMEDE